MRKFPVTGFVALLLLFIGGGFVSSDPGPISVGVQTAGHLQDSHVSYYQEHLARLQIGFNCR